MRGLAWIGVVAFSLALAACSKPAPQPASDSAATTTAPTTTTAPIPISLGPPMYIQPSTNYLGAPAVTIKNTGSAAFTLNKLVVNGQAGDSDCDLKLFKSIDPGKEEVIPVPRCGNITKLTVMTDKGDVYGKWEGADLTTTVSLGTNELGPTVVINNAGSQELVVEKLIVNEQASDASCNIKMFVTIAAQTAYTQSVPSCGQIKKVQLVTKDKTANFAFD